MGNENNPLYREVKYRLTTKKKIPWELLYIALLFILAGAYYVSGLFTFPDVNLINYGDYLTYILLHPFHLWWNDKTPVVMGTACILWLMGVSYFLTYYRNYHFGAEHGTADWGDVSAMKKKLADPDPMKNRSTERESFIASANTPPSSVCIHLSG